MHIHSQEQPNAKQTLLIINYFNKHVGSIMRYIVIDSAGEKAKRQEKVDFPKHKTECLVKSG